MVRNSNYRSRKNIWKVASVHIISPRPMISSCADSVQEVELDKSVIFVYYSSKIIVFGVINCRVFPWLNSWWWEEARINRPNTSPWRLRFLYRIYFYKTQNIYKFKSCLRARGYPKCLIEILLSDIKFTERESALKQKNEDPKELSCPLWHSITRECHTLKKFY